MSRTMRAMDGERFWLLPKLFFSPPAPYSDHYKGAGGEKNHYKGAGGEKKKFSESGGTARTRPRA